MNFKNVLQALEDLKQGKLVIVVDDEDRENEGDLVCAAENVTAANINFMATYGKGLICLPMSQDIANRLNITPMSQVNTDNHETPFGISIDYIDTTTGISAFERALTAQKCCEENINGSFFRRPGHMFPLIAKDNGVLVRNGHTEATVDCMKLAGLKPCGLCCEIMNDDGTMMRQKDLEKFASNHSLTMISIKELQEYRKTFDNLVECTSISKLPTKYGEFIIYAFVDKITNEHHVALVKGNTKDKENVLCRIHSECLTGDAFGSMKCDCGEQLAKAMTTINNQGLGVVVYMRQEGRGIGLINKLKAYALQDKGLDTLEANLALGLPADAREYHIAAQILKYLEVKSIDLMTNNPLKIDGLRTYGINVVKREKIQMPTNEYDENYLKTKQEKMGHMLDFDNIKNG